MSLQETLISEIELQEVSEVNYNGKVFYYRQLPVVSVRLTEEELFSCKYSDDAALKSSEARIAAIKPKLNELCDKIDRDYESMQNFISFDDNNERLKMIHVFLEMPTKSMLITSYTTYCSATEQYVNDLTFLKEIKKYIQRKSELYNYELKSIDMFGVIYHLEKKAEEENNDKPSRKQ